MVRAVSAKRDVSEKSQFVEGKEVVFGIRAYFAMTSMTKGEIGC